MAALNPYLNFNGNTEQAFNFYKSIFGGEFIMLQRFGDVPADVPRYGTADDKIMHVALPIGNGNILMGSDVPTDFTQATAGTNVHLSLSTGSEEEARNIFDALSNGGKVTMPLDKMFWGAYFGMLTDPFGIHWMVSYDYNRQ